MNKEQILGFLRPLIAAGTPLAAWFGARGFKADEVLDWIMASIPIVMGIWSAYANRHAAQVTAANKIPGVEVLVTKAAPESVVALAEDTSPATANVKMAPARR